MLWSNPAELIDLVVTDALPMNGTRNTLLIVATVALVSACGGRQTRGVDSGGAAESVMTFEPMLIRGSVGEDGVETRADSLTELFNEAGDYLRAESFEEALELYELVEAHADDDELERASVYNGALALEGMEDFAEAAERYRHVIRGWPATDDATDAFFRLAECEAKLENFGRVPPLMDRVRERIGLSLDARFEAHLRAGNAYLEQRLFAEASAEYRGALDLNETARLQWNPESGDADERPLEGDDPLLAHLHFALGRVYHELFAEIRLVLPEARLTQDLIDKTQLFEQAQDAYLDSVRTGNRYWSPAAGFMVGQLFEDYYFDVLATEVPDDFNELELEVYFEELRAYIRPAMERALGVYEHNLAMAYRLGAQNEWVDDTLESILRVHRYLDEQPGWDEEHRLVIEGRHPHSAPREARTPRESVGERTSDAAHETVAGAVGEIPAVR